MAGTPEPIASKTNKKCIKLGFTYMSEGSKSPGGRVGFPFDITCNFQANLKFPKKTGTLKPAVVLEEVRHFYFYGPAPAGLSLEPTCLHWEGLQTSLMAESRFATNVWKDLSSLLRCTKHRFIQLKLKLCLKWYIHFESQDSRVQVMEWL